MNMKTMIAEGIPNRTVFFGDNAEYLRELPSESVDLIATDPPYNTLRGFTSAPDSKMVGEGYTDKVRWDPEIQSTWLKQCEIVSNKDKRLYALSMCIQTAMLSHSPGLAAYLCFLSYRLLECHRILKPTGSLFLQCDIHANAYIKQILDIIFGHKGLINEIVWGYSTGGASDKRLARKHDTIFHYAKSDDNYYFQCPRVPYTSNMSKDKNHQHKFHADGKIMLDWWDDIAPVNPKATERCGYPTQKPIKLYSRQIQMACPPNGVVFDPFMGSGASLIAAELHEARWMGCDYYATSDEFVKRLRHYCHHLMNDNDCVHPKFSANGLGGETSVPILLLDAQSAQDLEYKSKESLKQHLIAKCNGFCKAKMCYPHDLEWELHRRKQGAIGGKYDLDNCIVLHVAAHRAFHSTPEGRNVNKVYTAEETYNIARAELDRRTKGVNVELDLF